LLLGTRLEDVPKRIEELLKSLGIQAPQEEIDHATASH